MMFVDHHNDNYLEKIVYHFFRQLWLVLGVKLMEINSNLFSQVRCELPTFLVGKLVWFYETPTYRLESVTPEADPRPSTWCQMVLLQGITSPSLGFNWHPYWKVLVYIYNLILIMYIYIYTYTNILPLWWTVMDLFSTKDRYFGSVFAALLLYIPSVLPGVHWASECFRRSSRGRC